MSIHRDIEHLIEKLEHERSRCLITQGGDLFLAKSIILDEVCRELEGLLDEHGRACLGCDQPFFPRGEREHEQCPACECDSAHTMMEDR